MDRARLDPAGRGLGLRPRWRALVRPGHYGAGPRAREIALTGPKPNERVTDRKVGAPEGFFVLCDPLVGLVSHVQGLEQRRRCTSSDEQFPVVPSRTGFFPWQSENLV